MMVDGCQFGCRSPNSLRGRDAMSYDSQFFRCVVNEYLVFKRNIASSQSMVNNNQ